MRGSRVRYNVALTHGAERDLESIHDHIARFDSIANADHVLDQLMSVADTLVRFPERAPYPKELLALGIKEYRQVSFKPYRIIYRIAGRQVFIVLIVDGRRDMQSLLARRLLGA